jgi:O-antigen/teichoic acid export membrane protein
MTSLKKLAIRGTLWTLFSYGTSNVLRLISNLILTRLLFPELFGLMALVNTIIIGLNLFSDIGFGPNIVQNKRGDDPNFLNTAWTLQIIRASIIWLFCCLLAFPLAQFYGRSELLWLLPILGLGSFIAGFQSTTLYSLSRHMQFGRLESFSLTEQVIALTVMLVWAYFNPSIWALVAGSLVGPVFRVFWTHNLVPGGIHNHLMLEPESVKELISFGKWIFFSTASTFLGVQADRLILGKLITFAQLGVYGIALNFADLPRQVVSAISSKVLLPTFAKIADLPRWELRMRLLRNRQKVLLGAALLLTPLVCLGDLVIKTLYDRRYAEAAWMLPILALGIWPNILHESIRQSLMAIGKPKYEAFGQFSKCLLVCVGVPLGFHFLGMLGAVIVVACNDIPLYTSVSIGLTREGLSSIKQDLQITAILIGMLTIGLAGRWFLGFGFPIQSLFIASGQG